MCEVGEIEHGCDGCELRGELSHGLDDLVYMVFCFLCDGFEDGLGHDIDGDIVAFGAVQLKFLVSGALFAMSCSEAVIP